VKGILKNTAIKYFIREIISLSMNVRPKMTADGLQLKEVGGFYGNAFAEKIFSFTTNLSRGTLPPISFRCCYGMGY
jgi:hypothetical protein